MIRIKKAQEQLSEVCTICGSYYYILSEYSLQNLHVHVSYFLTDAF